MTNSARPGIDDKAGANPSSDLNSNPRSGDTAGPLAIAILAGANSLGGPASIRDPHAGVCFLNPLPMPVSPPSGHRTGRWSSPSLRPSARELLDNPTTRNLRSALIGAGLFSTLTSLSFGFPVIAGICVGLTAFGLVISKPAKRRAAASPRLSHSSRAHTPALDTCRANAAFSKRPQIGAPVAKLCVALRSLIGIVRHSFNATEDGAGALRDAEKIGVRRV